MALRRCVDGPLDGRDVPARSIVGTGGWIDTTGRVHAKPGTGRFRYDVDGRHRLRFKGHGYRCCGNCGAELEPDAGWPLPRCPLCGGVV